MARAVVLLTVAVILAALGIYAAIAERPFGLDWSEEALGAWVESLEDWGGFGIIVLMVVHSLAPFPAEIVAFLAGRLYGVVWGTVYAWTGAMLGALLAYGIARAMGRRAVDALLTPASREKLAYWMRRRSVDGLLIVRVIPIVSFNLINYAAGLMHVGLWTFVWTTGLGILPLTVFFVYLGERMQNRSWQEWAVVVGLGLALWAAVHVIRLTLGWTGPRVGIERAKEH